MMTQAVRRGGKLRLISLDEVANCFPFEAEMDLSCCMESDSSWFSCVENKEEFNSFTKSHGLWKIINQQKTCYEKKLI